MAGILSGRHVMESPAPAQAAYDRLIAAQRIVSREEIEETEAQDRRDAVRSKIRRKLQKVY